MTEIGPKRPTVERTVFSTSRAAEFLEVRALQAQTGQPAKAFGHVVLAALQLVLRHGGTGADRGHCAAKPTCWMSWRVGTELAADHRSSRWPGSADSLTPRHNAVGPPNNPRVEEHVEDADGQPNGP